MVPRRGHGSRYGGNACAIQAYRHDFVPRMRHEIVSRVINKSRGTNNTINDT